MAGLNIKSGFKHLLLVTLSTVISLVAAEAITRAVVDPVNYLEPYLIKDDVLGHKIAPNSAGHDSWGFRNRAVPRSADIVSIGDSQTYGVSATAANSWPAQLQKLTHARVYNLSLGGYGPVEYYYLLNDKALRLRPKVIIIGFYFGNDLFDAYSSVYGKKYWNFLRRADYVPERQELAIGYNAPTYKVMGSLREWLAHHSILYRVFTFSFGDLFRFFEMKYGSSRLNGDVTVFEDKQSGNRTGFTPLTRLIGLNLEDARVKEGLRLTLEILLRMKEICAAKETQFIVLLIPTKETVFANYIERRQEYRTLPALNELIKNEQEINRIIKKYFEVHRISYVDVLGDLQTALPKRRLYFANGDGHPNAEGYKVIAKSLNRVLRMQSH